MSENQNETPTIDDAVEETRDLIDRMASAIKSVKGSQTAINAQDIPNEIRSIVGVPPVTKTYYAVRPYLSDIGDLLKPYVDFSLDTSNLTRTTGNIGWLNGVPRFEWSNVYTYKYKNSYASHFANRGKTYTSTAINTIVEKCSELAREDYDTSKGYLTILEYQELYNEAHTRVTDFCLYLYKQVYTITESGGHTYYTLESDTNFARLNISVSGNNLDISSIITENIPARANIDDSSSSNPIYNAASCILYGDNYDEYTLNKSTIKRVNTINAQDFPTIILNLDTRYLAPNGEKYDYKTSLYISSGAGTYNFYTDFPLFVCEDYKTYTGSYHLLTHRINIDGIDTINEMSTRMGSYELSATRYYPQGQYDGYSRNLAVSYGQNESTCPYNWAVNITPQEVEDQSITVYTTMKEAYEAITGKHVGPDDVAYTYHYYGESIVSGRTYGVDSYSNVKLVARQSGLSAASYYYDGSALVSVLSRQGTKYPYGQSIMWISGYEKSGSTIVYQDVSWSLNGSGNIYTFPSSATDQELIDYLTS